MGSSLAVTDGRYSSIEHEDVVPELHHGTMRLLEFEERQLQGSFIPTAVDCPADDFWEHVPWKDSKESVWYNIVQQMTNKQCARSVALFRRPSRQHNVGADSIHLSIHFP